MSYRPGLIGSLNLLLWAMALLLPLSAWGNYELPTVATRQEYGNVLLDRASSAAGVKPVTFSHWTHRKRYTCGVCHSELAFNMRAGSTPIAEAGHESSIYCGACHDGGVAFGTQGHCADCHSGGGSYDRKEWVEFSRKRYPPDYYGNGVDWVKALESGMIRPAPYLRTNAGEVPFEKDLTLEPGLCRIPPAIFPHRQHGEWMDCNTCHPDVFGIKQRTTRHFSMSAILEGEFCGACHLNVAFPIHDCWRCHPEMRER
jgi:c(7)-type cytochrome triheme protein